MSDPKTTFANNQAARRVIAAIDVGSSSVRMCIAEVDPSGRYAPVETLRVPVCLGADTFTAGRLSSEGILAACEALGNFRKAMKAYQVEQFQAVATSAVREASNCDTFVDRVASATGIRLEVLDGMDETRLAYGVLRANLRAIPDFGDSDSILMALSSGSAKITVFHRGRIIFSEALRTGTLRLRQMLREAPRAKFVQLLDPVIDNVVASVKRRVPLEALVNFILISPDVSRLPALGAREGEAAGLKRIARDRFEQLAQEATALDPLELAERYALDAVEAETLAPALIAIDTFLGATQADHLTVLDVGMLDTLLAAMAGASLCAEADETDFVDQIASCAVGIGRKYHFDEAHSLHVSQLAMQLFDQLRSLHGLTNADGILLRTAGILHDIGMYISSRMHHKHSMYLVNHSECFGLTRHQMDLVAVICRYHRRAMPRPQHAEYASLTREDRLRVSKLAALLRIADSLDRSHTAAVRDLRCRLAGGRLVLEALSDEDLSLDAMALRNKGNLFEELYGLPVTLQRCASLET